MKLRRKFLQGFAAAGLAGFLLPASASDVLKVGGTGSALGTMQVLADAYAAKHPGFQLKIVPNLGSGGGIKAAAAGAVDFAVASRDLSGDERAAGLESAGFGRTPFAVVTNRTDVDDVSRAQLADMLSGRVATWKDGVPVRLVLRPVADSDTKLLAEFSPDVGKALAEAQSRSGMVRAATDQESADQSERLQGSLGTACIALLLSEKRALRVLKLDGVEPSVANLVNGRYPYAKTQFLVTKGRPSAAVQRFFDFIGSDEGRAILTRLGHHVPTAI